MPVNCAVLGDELFESELFQPRPGGPSPAPRSTARGLLELSSGGTVFLDELAELAPRAQAKLLRVLRDGEVRRLDENPIQRLDLRVVAGTNRPLEAEVAAGRFRSDLLYRLKVLRLTAPPLRDRGADIARLTVHCWKDIAAVDTVVRKNLDIDRPDHVLLMFCWQYCRGLTAPEPEEYTVNPQQKIGLFRWRCFVNAESQSVDLPTMAPSPPTSPPPRKRLRLRRRTLAVLDGRADGAGIRFAGKATRNTCEASCGGSCECGAGSLIFECQKGTKGTCDGSCAGTCGSCGC